MKSYLLIPAVALGLFLSACDSEGPISSTDDISVHVAAKSDKSEKTAKVVICHNDVTAVAPHLLVALIDVPAGTVPKHVSLHGDCVCNAEMAADLELPFCEDATCESVLDENSNRIADGCETGEFADADGDGIDDAADNCPNLANADQTNTDGDALGDACDDDDDDDTVNDDVDNCPRYPNPGQTDTDFDNIGNECDDDDDNDGLNDNVDNCPLFWNPDQLDWDSDGEGNECDEDDDNDGVVDTEDNCPLEYGEGLDGCPVAATACPCWSAAEILAITTNGFPGQFCEQSRQPWIILGQTSATFFGARYTATGFEPNTCQAVVLMEPMPAINPSDAETFVCMQQIADRCAALGYPITAWWPTSAPEPTSPEE